MILQSFLRNLVGALKRIQITTLLDVPLSRDIANEDNAGEEIWQAIKQIGPLKAPGLDGLDAIFYQKCSTGKLILNMIENFFIMVIFLNN